VNFPGGPNRDVEELAGFIESLGRDEFTVFLCVFKLPTRAIRDILVDTLEYDAKMGVIELNPLYKDVFTSETHPDLCNGVIAKVSVPSSTLKKNN
jgi:hypothetical protein